MLNRILFVLLLAISVNGAQSQNQSRPENNPWQSVETVPQNRTPEEIWIRPERFRSFHLDHVALQGILARVPTETAQPLAAAATQITLPMPDGSVARFRIVESPVMAPELAAKFPEIKTYLGQGIDDPTASVRFDITPQGFHAQILSPQGAVYIDPMFRGDANLHASYYKRDYRRVAEQFQCLTPGSENVSLRAELPADLARSGTSLRTYRLACAATGEYTQFHGGTVAAGMAAIVTAINRVTGVYETEVAIRLVLVANNDLIVYVNGNTDPYNNTSGSMMLGQNQANLDAVIGNANYDIGHVFSTGGGGIAGLGVVCLTGNKARGVTGLSAPTGDAFYIDYVAHEMGHQFGANHPFNSSTGSCGGGNRNASTAYEPGSGSTIMAYAGICGSDDLQPHSDPYFHSISFDEIISYSTTGSGNSCPMLSATGNSVPTVSAGANYTIPKATPFTVTATGSDPDGEPLTFCWEERDLGPSTTVTAPDNGSSPIFRSFNPTSDPSRTFPRMQDLLNNTSTVGEILPTTSRTLHFRVTARDNHAGGGGVNTADTQITVSSSAGPFVVTSHNSGGTFSGLQTVTWSVAGTAGAPINASNVVILLSTNGGLNFPIVLATDTPNVGSATVVFPNLTTAGARIKVQAADNIFFDLGNSTFSIVPSIPTPLIVIDSASLAAEDCVAANGAIDPGESVTVNVALRNAGTADTTNLVATLFSINGVSSPSGPQSYGSLSAGGAAFNQPFSFTASGPCGGTIAAVFALQDDATSFGTVTQVFTLGSSVAATGTVANTTQINIPATGNRGKASPYPSTISISGITGAVSRITVTLNGFTHTFPDDVDVVLVGPTGQSLLLMSDVGGGNPAANAVLAFDDAASDSLPDTDQIVSGTYKPTNFDTTTDGFASPAPAGPYGQTLSAFNGLDPNGTWSLFVNDDSNKDSGKIAQGWSLSITTSRTTCCSGSSSVADMALGSGAAPDLVNVGGNVTFTLSVTNVGPDTANDVGLTNALPAGFNFVSAISSQGTCTNNNGSITCALGSMTNGATAEVTIVAAATTPGTWTNIASAGAATSDFNPANNTTAVVVAVNSPPTISTINNQTNDENMVTGPIAFTIGDFETPASALAVSGASSNTNLVADADLDFEGSDSIRTVTITPQPNQFGAATITVTVSDGLTNASTSFWLVIHAVNHRPVLAALDEYVVNEGATLVFTNTATDADLPAQSLTFSLSNAPPGAMIDPASGVFTWTPFEAQGPGTNVITILVTDDGAPNLTDEKSVAVIVKEVNEPPWLAGISNYTIFEGETLVISNTAGDVDLPANGLTFSLGANAPAGATVDPANGAFTWTPDEEQGPGTNLIELIVADDGTPSLSATQRFTVIVLETNSPPILAAVADRRIHVGTTLVISNHAKDADVPTNVLTFSLETGAPPSATIDAASGEFTWAPDDSFAGTVNTITVRVSDDGGPSLSDVKSFAVNVVSRPVIESISLSNGTVTLTWSAVANLTYRVQCKTNLNETNWTDLAPDITASGPSASMTDFMPTEPRQKFYRATLAP